MASHHHHHHCQPPPSTTSSCYCYHYSTCYTPPPPPDPHLHSPLPPFHHHHNPPPHPHLTPPHQPFHHHNQTPHHPPQTHQDFHHQTQPTVSSLLSRIAALESSILRRQYSSNSASPTSLRDAAARTIQTHFRAFLVRRSRTLRQLKDLASVKSALNALKASSNQNAHLDCQMISRRAMSLLLKLDSIQGGDPMIRDGKRSISRDIIRFMEFIDGVTVKRTEISSIALKNVRYGRTGGSKIRVMYGDGRVLGERSGKKIHGFSMGYEDDHDDEEGIEVENPRIPVNGKGAYSRNKNGGFEKIPAKVKKNVSFAENGNVYRVFASTREPISSGDNSSGEGSGSGSGSGDDEREIVDNLRRGVKEIRVLSKGDEDDEEAHSEDGGSPHSSDGGRNHRRNLRDEDSYELVGHSQGENEEFTFSTLLPVKMESGADLMKKRNSLKIVE